jgi:molecular chaperone GrpE
VNDGELSDSGQEELELNVEEITVPLTDGEAESSKPGPEDPLSVETLLESLEGVTAERDDFRDSLQRLQAEFENFRRRSSSETEQRISAGVSRLAETLLPVLDACDAAAAQGLQDVTPIQNALETVLNNNGLTRIETLGAPFDPTRHEAMSFETGEGNEQVVVEELRPGYLWSGAVLRPAMVKVREQ